jgi:hypothetical protein
MERIANFVYKRSKLIIALVVVFNIAAAISFYRFNIDTDFLSTFSQGNPKAAEFNQLNAKYQSGEAITVLAEKDDSLLNKQNLIAIFRLQEEIKGIDGISSVQSLLPPQIFLPGEIVPVNEQFISTGYEQLRDFIENKYFMTDQFLSSDKQSSILVVTLGPDAPARKVVRALNEIASDSEDLTISLAGNQVIRDTLWSYLLRILYIVPPCAISLVLLVFIAVLRSPKLSVLSIIPAGIGALWTFGTIFWSAQELSLVTIISPIFVLVMGAADGLHYTSHFIDNMHQYSERRQLTVETLKMVGVPIFLTTITTMAGFASLTWTDVAPMRQMGIFVALGIGYAGLVSLFFLPAVLSRIKLPAKPPAVKESRLNRLVLAASRQRVLIIVVFLALVGVSAFYIPRIEVVSNQLMFFKESSEIRQTFARVEEHFGGALPLTGEIISPAGQVAIADYEYATRVLTLERELENMPGIASAFSIFDFIKGINSMVTGQDAYPRNPMLIQGLMTQMGGQDLRSWVSSDGFKLVIRTQGLSSSDIDRLNEFVARNQETIRVITGMPVLFDEMNNLVVQSQIQSLGLALVLIFLMLWLTLRKLRAALVGLLPITITIAAILGMLSVTDFNLNIMTATLSAIAIGVGVDYSIHLISGIYYFQRQGLGRPESVTAALTSVSRPVLANAFGLSIGLSALFFSPLRIHIHAASVMWVAMVVSSLAALLLTPLFYSGRAGQPEKAAEKAE